MTGMGRRRPSAVAGFCPMGCGQTLARTDREIGEIRCVSKECPQPNAVATILAEPETEHLVVVGDSGYTIQHPLRERVNRDLFECPIHAFVSDTVHERMDTPGLYRVAPLRRGDGALRWERMADAQL